MLGQSRSVALLIARVVVGGIFLVHGYQKFATMGIAGTTKFFESAGIPLAAAAAPAVAVLELAGGLALILGVALPVVGTLLALDMVGAILFVHGANGFGVDKGGYEFVLSLAAGALAVGFSGGGALALDRLRSRRRTPESVAA
jgi:putative oxidoreductase